MNKVFDCSSKEYAPYLTFPLSGWEGIIQSLLPQRYPKGAVICHRNGEDENVVLIKSGVVTMSFIHLDGAEYIHFLGSEGYVFGFRSCLSGRPYGGTLTAFTEVEVYKIPSHVVKEAMQRSSDFLEFVMYGEYERGLAYSRKLELLALPGNTNKIAALLLSLGEKIGVDAGGAITIPLKLTHDNIARIIYSDRVTVSRALSLFEKRGLIKKEHGFFKIYEKEKLREYL